MFLLQEDKLLFIHYKHVPYKHYIHIGLKCLCWGLWLYTSLRRPPSEVVAASSGGWHRSLYGLQRLPPAFVCPCLLAMEIKRISALLEGKDERERLSQREVVVTFNTFLHANTGPKSSMGGHTLSCVILLQECRLLFLRRMQQMSLWPPEAVSCSDVSAMEIWNSCDRSRKGGRGGCRSGKWRLIHAHGQFMHTYMLMRPQNR